MEENNPQTNEGNISKEKLEIQGWRDYGWQTSLNFLAVRCGAKCMGLGITQMEVWILASATFLL